MFKITSTCKGGGYIYCRTLPPHPNRNSNNLYPLHRVVLENKIGRLLVKGECVHHLDENKNNNHPDNLSIMTVKSHSRHHAVKAAPKDISCKCGQCGKIFNLKS